MPTDSLEALITKASYSKLPADYDLVFAVLQTRTLYFAVQLGPPMTIATHRAGDFITLGGFLTRALVRPVGPAGGIIWPEIQTMLLKMPDEIMGVQVINAANDWVIIPRQRIINHLTANAPTN